MSSPFERGQTERHLRRESYWRIVMAIELSEHLLTTCLRFKTFKYNYGLEDEKKNVMFRLMNEFAYINVSLIFVNVFVMGLSIELW